MTSKNESFDESFNLGLWSNDLINNSSFISTNSDIGNISYTFGNFEDIKYNEISREINYDAIKIPIIDSIPTKNEAFIIKKYKKRGRSLTKNTRKIRHKSNSSDNILSKIQVHFFSFIIDIVNDALFTEFHEKKTNNFKGINYKIKTKFNFLLFEKYKKYSIKDILKLEVSPKFKCFQIDYNNQLLEKVSNLSNWLDKFFNMNYLKLFNYYYNNRKPLNVILFEGKEIKLSKKTKSFYNLLEKNKSIEKELIRDAESHYFNKDYAFFCIDEKS